MESDRKKQHWYDNLRLLNHREMIQYDVDKRRKVQQLLNKGAKITALGNKLYVGKLSETHLKHRASLIIFITNN